MINITNIKQGFVQRVIIPWWKVIGLWFSPGGFFPLNLLDYQHNHGHNNKNDIAIHLWWCFKDVPCFHMVLIVYRHHRGSTTGWWLTASSFLSQFFLNGISFFAHPISIHHHGGRVLRAFKNSLNYEQIGNQVCD